MAARQRDLFKPAAPADKINPLFRQVAQGAGHAAARTMANAVFENMRDVDRTFIREFQTGGFSPRVFELALFAFLQEQGLVPDREHAAPDFVVRGDLPVAIEVTTTNPAQDAPLDLGPPYSILPDDLDIADAEFVFQVGKALRRKILHRDAQGDAYWEKPHVVGLPFVIAVGAFHSSHAQVHPDAVLAAYLYGVRSVGRQDETGTLTVTPEEVIEHRSAGKAIPSGLFRHSEAANLSGVLFSNAHTISMFNRIGAERGYAASDTALMRFGMCYDYAPNAWEPESFAYVVGDRPEGERETFAEGLHLFINPWAAVPLTPEAFPGVVCYQVRTDGLLGATFTRTFRPFVSKTLVFEQEHAQELARYAQLQFLKRLPAGAPRIVGDVDLGDDPDMSRG